jgi:MFS family permease
MAAFVISLDTTIVNVALPSLVRELRASTTDLQWVVDAYSLVFAALILAAGSLSDRLGRKGTLLVGLGVFGGASLAGSAGATVHQLVAARAVMGLGAALMFPSTLSLISNISRGCCDISTRYVLEASTRPTGAGRRPAASASAAASTPATPQPIHRTSGLNA